MCMSSANGRCTVPQPDHRNHQQPPERPEVVGQPTLDTTRARNTSHHRDHARRGAPRVRACLISRLSCLQVGRPAGRKKLGPVPTSQVPSPNDWPRRPLGPNTNPSLFTRSLQSSWPPERKPQPPPFSARQHTTRSIRPPTGFGAAPAASLSRSNRRNCPKRSTGGGGGGEEGGSLSIYRFMRQPDQPSLVGASSTGHVKLFPRCGMDDNTAWMHGAVRHGGRLDQQVVVVVGMALFFARVVMREREGTCTSKSARQSSLRRCILLHQVLPRPSSACLTICKRTQV